MRSFLRECNKWTEEAIIVAGWRMRPSLAETLSLARRFGHRTTLQ